MVYVKWRRTAAQIGRDTSRDKPPNIAGRFVRPLYIAGVQTPQILPLLEIWKHATFSDDLARAVERIAVTARARVPLEAIAIGRLDTSRGVIETVATGRVRPSAPLPPARLERTAEQLRRLAEWGRSDDGAALRGDPVADLAGAAELPADRAVVVLGLSSGGADGVALVVPPASHRPTESDLAFLRAIRDPLAVAHATDARLRELTRLRSALEADRQALLERLDREAVSDTIVGGDSGLREVMEQIDHVAATDAPVLLLGETGTGKEVVARAIHGRSRRARGPVVRVNCGAIPAGLIDSELFGHERGSFTGAVSERKGWFERADGGTLFLDEIGELTADAQVRLLRILQDGTFERVGGHRTRVVDVRLVAATNRDLHAMVARGAFREDLWYRISVFPVRIPPVRERREDIPALAAHFAWRAGKRLGGLPLAITPDDIDLLLAYPWPGNVRELAAVIERAAILGGGKTLRLAAALGVQGSRGEAPAPAASSAIASDILDDGLTLDAAMARHIERALRATGGRIEGAAGAAQRLGIHPQTLRARMRKLGVDWSRFRSRRQLGIDDDPHW